MLDPAAPRLAWVDLTGSALGAVPSQRSYHSMTSAGGLLFVFGGWPGFTGNGHREKRPARTRAHMHTRPTQPLTYIYTYTHPPARPPARLPARPPNDTHTSIHTHKRTRTHAHAHTITRTSTHTHTHGPCRASRATVRTGRFSARTIVLGLRRRCCRRVTATHSCALHDGEMADVKGRRRKGIIQSCSAELLQPVESDPDQTVAPIRVKRVSQSHLPQPERPLSTALPPGPRLERCPRRRQATSTTCTPTTPRPTFGPSLASSPGPAPRLGRLWGSRSSQTASISSVAAPTMTQACVKPPGLVRQRILSRWRLTARSHATCRPPYARSCVENRGSARLARGRPKRTTERLWPALFRAREAALRRTQPYALRPLHAGDFDDLFAFEPSTSVWTNLSVVGPAPSPRKYHGFTSAGGLLYLFGGLNIEAGAARPPGPGSAGFCPVMRAVHGQGQPALSVDQLLIDVIFARLANRTRSDSAELVC